MTDPPEYKVSYRLTSSAVADAGRLHVATFLARYRIVMAVLSFVGVMLFLGGIRSLGTTLAIFGFLLVATTWAGFLDRMLISSQARGVLGGTASYVADDEGLHYENPLGSGVVPWSGLTRVRSNDKTIVFSRDRVLAAYIPTDAFASAAERDSFIAFARAHIGRPSDVRRR